MRNLIFTLLLTAATFQVLAQAPKPAAEPDPALFEPIAAVVMHPRCLNCHQIAAPAQTDAMNAHAQRVIRGADGHGAPTLKCAACHQASNSADGRVPGAPNWHLAPLSMNWQSLSKAQICEQIKDPKRNGNRTTPNRVVAHMMDDPLVLWAWEPGADRSKPVMSHAVFVKALTAWADAGMPCPK